MVYNLKVIGYTPFLCGYGGMADALDSGSNGRKAVQVQVLLPAPWRVFLQHLKSCKNTLFCCFQPADFKWSVVDKHCLSGIVRQLLPSRNCKLSFENKKTECPYRIFSNSIGTLALVQQSILNPNRSIRYQWQFLHR